MLKSDFTCSERVRKSQEAPNPWKAFQDGTAVVRLSSTATIQRK